MPRDLDVLVLRMASSLLPRACSTGPLIVPIVAREESGLPDGQRALVPTGNSAVMSETNTIGDVRLAS